jgi:hypothetical protein
MGDLNSTEFFGRFSSLKALKMNVHARFQTSGRLSHKWPWTRLHNWTCILLIEYF